MSVFQFSHKGIESHIETLFKTRQPRTAFEIKMGNYPPTKYLNINLEINSYVTFKKQKHKNLAILKLKYIKTLKILTQFWYVSL